MLRVNKQNNDLNNLQHAEGTNSNKLEKFLAV